MNPAVLRLYEPMIERDDPGIRAAAFTFAADEGDQSLFEAVARFAIAGANPSQHGMHALMAVAEAPVLRDATGGRWRELLIELALYAAHARLPWSEPPIPDPPPPDPSIHGRDEEIREAILAKDTLQAERWLAEVLTGNPVRAFFHAAALDLSDTGAAFAVSVAAWRIGALLDGPSFPTLRAAARRWTATGETAPAVRDDVAWIPAELCEALVEEFVTSAGDLESMQRLALFDALLAAEDAGAVAADLRRVASLLGPRPIEVRDGGEDREESVVYPLARDYGANLRAHAIVLRRRKRFPAAGIERILPAAGYNLRASSFEDWSHA